MRKLHFPRSSPFPFGFRRGLSLGLALAAGLPLHSQVPGFLKVQVAFYDHEIGGIEGEFGARKDGECGYSTAFPGPSGKTWAVTSNMVADTLPYSKELSKKIPQVGVNNCNSSNLEKWFDPAFATSSSCRELPFASAIDSNGILTWRYEDSLFFPIDSMAPAGQLEGQGEFAGVAELTYPLGYSGSHNFNWCMEINAQFKYRGGEVFDFKGDDDVWVYLDNHLVVDLGGIHGPIPAPKLLLDTLPFIAGKQGEVFDFDLYFCERRPAGSSFLMQTSLDIEPIRLRDLEIVRGDGQVLNPKDPVVGMTRLCAMPAFPAATAQNPCGNQAPIPTEPFYPANWAVNGTVLAKNVECIDLDPLTLPANQRISLTAKAEGKTARLNIQVLKANIPSQLVLKGNGHLESLEIPMDAKSELLVAPIRIEYPFAGKQRVDSAGPESFNSITRTLSLSLAAGAQGPSGFSGLDSAKGLILQTVIGFPLSFPVLIKDSITPALRRASWQFTQPQDNLHLDLAPSEIMSPQFQQTVSLVFKNKQGTSFRIDLGNAKPILPGVDSFRVVFPVHAPFQPKDVDSVSFLKTMTDIYGNPAQLNFVPILPISWSLGQAVQADVRLIADPTKSVEFDPIITNNSIVLVNQDGFAVDPGGVNAELAAAKGPMLIIRSEERLDRLEVWVYTNLGAFVSHSVHVFSDSEWDGLAQAAPGDTVTAQVVLYPAVQGAKFGTGAYIVKGSISTHAHLKLFGPLRFGYLRR